MKKFDMTKEMHLSQLHNPYANQREEHYCRRWVSVDVIRQFLEQNQENEIAAAQVSSYINTDHDYLCLSLAKASTDAPGCSTSVTMGMLVNEKLRETFRWIDDPNLPVKKVHTTCERCPIADCDVRVAPPAVLQLNQAKADLKEALDILRKKKPEELQTR